MVTRITLIALISISMLLNGCAFTSAGTAQEMMPIYQKQYELMAESQARVVKEVMDTLKSIKRGGMDLELDDEGKVKRISYTEHLDASVLRQALTVKKPEMPRVKSGAEETAMMIGALTGLVVPVASMYYGFKINRDSVNANVAIQESNNRLQDSVFAGYTSTYKNESKETVVWPPDQFWQESE